MLHEELRRYLALNDQSLKKHMLDRYMDWMESVGPERRRRGRALPRAFDFTPFLG